MNPKEKELHSVARNKVVTNPRAKSIPRKVKDVMANGETQEVARSSACRRMKTNLKDPYTHPREPSRPVESPPPPPPRITGEEKGKTGEKELHSVARSKVKTNPRTRSTPRKIKEVMTHGETQKAAVAPSCCERVKVNQKLSRPQSPVKQTNTRDLPPNTGGEIHKSAEAGSRAGTRRSRQGKSSTGPARTVAPSPRSRSPLSRTAKDRGMAARIANPESEGEYSDPGDPDYTVVSDGGERAEESEADTLVPGAVQHVRQTGYPSPRRVKKNKAVKKSVDVNEKPDRKNGRKLNPYNPKPTKAQLVAEPITHHLYFRAAQDFTRPQLEKNEKPNLKLHKLLVEVTTPCGRLLDYEETIGRLTVLDYNKSILSANFNPSKFDFNPWDLDLHLEKGDQKNREKMSKDEQEKYKGGPSIAFRLYTREAFSINKGDRLGCAAMIPTVGVPNWSRDDQKLEEYTCDRKGLQEWDSMLR